LILRLGKGDSLLSAQLWLVITTKCLRATGGFMELVLRFDGEYGIGSIHDVECYFMTPEYVVVGEPILLPDLIDWAKVASLLPSGVLIRDSRNDSRKLGQECP
jgi:hypothetical protein